MIPAFLGSLSHSTCGDPSDAWPLIQNPVCCDRVSFCESYPGLTGEDENSFSPETEKTAITDSDNEQDLCRFTSTMSHFGSLTQSTEHPQETSCATASTNQVLAAAEEHDTTVKDSTD